MFALVGWLLTGASAALAGDATQMSPIPKAVKVAAVCGTCSSQPAVRETEAKEAGARCRVTVRRPPLSRKPDGTRRAAGAWCARDTKTGENFHCPRGLTCTWSVRCGARLSYCQNYTGTYYITSPCNGGYIRFHAAGRCAPKRSDHPRGVDWARHQN